MNPWILRLVPTDGHSEPTSGERGEFDVIARCALGTHNELHIHIDMVDSPAVQYYESKGLRAACSVIDVA